MGLDSCFLFWLMRPAAGNSMLSNEKRSRYKCVVSPSMDCGRNCRSNICNTETRSAFDSKLRIQLGIVDGNMEI